MFKKITLLILLISCMHIHANFFGYVNNKFSTLTSHIYIGIQKVKAIFGLQIIKKDKINQNTTANIENNQIKEKISNVKANHFNYRFYKNREAELDSAQSKNEQNIATTAIPITQPSNTDAAIKKDTAEFLVEEKIVKNKDKQVQVIKITNQGQSNVYDRDRLFEQIKDIYPFNKELKIESIITDPLNKQFALLISCPQTDKKCLALGCLKDKNLAIKRIEINNAFPINNIKFVTENNKSVLEVNYHLNDTTKDKLTLCTSCDIKNSQKNIFNKCKRFQENASKLDTFLQNSIKILPTAKFIKSVGSQTLPAMINLDQMQEFVQKYSYLEQEKNELLNILTEQKQYCSLCQTYFTEIIRNKIYETSAIFHDLNTQMVDFQTFCESTDVNQCIKNFEQHVIKQLPQYKNQDYSNRLYEIIDWNKNQWTTTSPEETLVHINKTLDLANKYDLARIPLLKELKFLAKSVRKSLYNAYLMYLENKSTQPFEKLFYKPDSSYALTFNTIAAQSFQIKNNLESSMQEVDKQLITLKQASS